MRNSTPLDGTVVAPSTTLEWKSSKSGKTIVHFLNSILRMSLPAGNVAMEMDSCLTHFFLHSSLQSPLELRSR